MSMRADDRGWFELVLSNQAPLWRMIAGACGGRVHANGGVQAAIVPQSPNRSFFNSVFYEDTGRMIGALPEVAAAYDDAGVNAWAVWAPESDQEAQAALESFGHVLDSWPRTMALELADLRSPEPDPELEITEQPENRMDMDTLARINEVAYGYPKGDMPLMSPMPGTWLYLAALDGEAVGTTVTWDRGEDCEVTFVATLPEARGRGVAKRLLAHALERARERGRSAATLISTKLGFPVYTALGYRDVGGLQMWELRKS